jgi:hypothetical protein
VWSSEIEPPPGVWIRIGKRALNCIRENSAVNSHERIVSKRILLAPRDGTEIIGKTAAI